MLSDFDVEIVERGYGKNYVRLLHVRREGATHFVKVSVIYLQILFLD